MAHSVLTFFTLNQTSKHFKEDRDLCPRVFFVQQQNSPFSASLVGSGFPGLEGFLVLAKLQTNQRGRDDFGTAAGGRRSQMGQNSRDLAWQGDGGRASQGGWGMRQRRTTALRWAGEHE